LHGRRVSDAGVTLAPVMGGCSHARRSGVRVPELDPVRPDPGRQPPVKTRTLLARGRDG